MKRLMALTCLLLALSLPSALAGFTAVEDHWAQWRGPFFNSVARTAAPVEFSDTKNRRLKR